MSETLSFHAKYLRWRPRILEVCDESTAAARPNRVPTRALVAAGLAIPSVVVIRKIQV